MNSGPEFGRFCRLISRCYQRLITAYGSSVRFLLRAVGNEKWDPVHALKRAEADRLETGQFLKNNRLAWKLAMAVSIGMEELYRGARIGTMTTKSMAPRRVRYWWGYS